MRYWLATLVVALSYPNIHCALAIHRFEKIYEDMLGKDEPLPVLTTFVIHGQIVFLTVSIVIPIVALALFFLGRLTHAIYIGGSLFVLTLIQIFFTWDALFSPLIKITEKMIAPQ